MLTNHCGKVLWRRIFIQSKRFDLEFFQSKHNILEPYRKPDYQIFILKIILTQGSENRFSPETRFAGKVPLALFLIESNKHFTYCI